MPVIADVPSMGMLLGLPAGILCIVGFLVAYRYAKRWQDRESRDDRYGDYKLALAVKWVALGLAAVALVATAASMYPFKHDYHWWVDKGGVVTEVSKRLVPVDGGGMQEKYVFTIDGKAYGVIGTRASLVKPGQRVKIRCKKVFEWGTSLASHGWDCKWAGPSEMEVSR